ncbi:MAG: hypothetical protein AB8U88_07625 [Rickettsia conorii subsp. raoultii]|uniref:Major facilitator superfamily (MFS) profile domain-containing protein n=3 Tax=Rickettsia conorii TaxID=781 RepID=A0ABY4TZJ7_RICCR|nr:hypothetical protein [Rickettsia conorii]URW77786.1 hypothetical protein NBT09_07445 [Rickettsia conorii subsp. raoultii]
MANLPTYAEWGYTASVCMIICRIVQGLSSIGEIVSAEIYITEITNPPIRYFAVAIIETIGLVGATVALIITTVAVVK